jgi:ubiquinol-cytochrome c reductase cytochrome c1 subunit
MLVLKMKKRIFGLLFACMMVSSHPVIAATQVALQKSPNQVCDQASLQRGAKLYVNYCQSCHAMRYVRYQTMAKDIGIVDENGKVLEAVVKTNLNFISDSVFDSMTNGMLPKDGAKWFGVTPPDLTLETRVRGTDWVYTYLKSFYVDPSRPWGVNNTVFPSVAMPHVLLELQGEQVLDPKTHQLTLAKPGKLSAQEYDQVVTDLVNFLDYSAEPIKLKREKMGIGVMIFLVIFLMFAYLLKREYWKDVH